MARSKRINFLASLTKGYDTVVDIGTDHGLVLKKAFDQGYIKHAIAADIKTMPLEQAKVNLNDCDVTFVLSDGFKQIDVPYDLAIIAGMGAYTICEIMSKATNPKATYILQPNDKHEILRTWLMNHEYRIVDEHVIFDGFYYVMMVAEHGSMTLSDQACYLGPILQYKDEAKPYYKHKLKTLMEIVKHADNEKKKYIEMHINDIKSVL